MHESFSFFQCVTPYMLASHSAAHFSFSDYHINSQSTLNMASGDTALLPPANSKWPLGDVSALGNRGDAVRTARPEHPTLTGIRPCPFAADANQIEFCDFRVGRTYRKRVTLWNMDKRVYPLRVLEQRHVTDTGFRVLTLENAKVGQGKSAAISVEFRPCAYRFHYDYFEIWAGREFDTLRILLQAYPTITLSKQLPTSFDFGLLAIGEKCYKGLQIYNIPWTYSSSHDEEGPSPSSRGRGRAGMVKGE